MAHIYMIGWVTRYRLPHLSGAPHLHVNRPLDLQATNTCTIDLYLYLYAQYLSIAITSISKRSGAWMTRGSIITCTALWHLL